jgi:metal-responsive CopG/Arc/MetJ family transcriptional regulator
MHHFAPLCITMSVAGIKSNSRRKAERKMRFSITVTPDTYKEIEQIANRESRSIAWVVRKAVENLVREEQPLFHQRTS